jgi:hypothetical protein
MSCCQQNNSQRQNSNSARMQIENFMESPTNYDTQKQTWEISQGVYYAPPWPAQRTLYDSGLQAQFNTIKLPDFLNYNDTVKRHQSLREARPSIKTGRYDNYSY